MNVQDNFDRYIASWLAEGPHRLPEAAIERIVGEIERTNERRPRWLPRRETMNRLMIAAGSVAAIGLIAVIGIGLASGGGFFRPGAPTATATTAPGPSAETPPGPTPEPQTLPNVDFSSILPGEYVDEAGAYGYVITVPSGWISAAGGSLIVNGSNFDTTTEDFAANSMDFASVGLATWWGDQAVVYTDPCHWQTTALSTGSTASDFSGALSQVAPMNPASEDISVGDWHGKHVRLTVPEDADFRTCDQGMYWGLEGRFYQAPGQVDEFWILDLAGGDRQMFGISYMPGTSQEVKDQLQQMVESMQVELSPR